MKLGSSLEPFCNNVHRRRPVFSSRLVLSAGGSFPHFVRSGRSVPPRRRADKAGESSPVYARGRAAEGRAAAGPPELAQLHNTHTHTHIHTHTHTHTDTHTHCPAEHSHHHLDVRSRERTTTHPSFSPQTHFPRRLLTPLTEEKVWKSLSFSVFKPSTPRYLLMSGFSGSLQEKDEFEKWC